MGHETPEMRARRAFKYNHRMLVAGDVFSPVSDRDADYLASRKFADLSTTVAPVVDVVLPAPDPAAAPSPVAPPAADPVPAPVEVPVEAAETVAPPAPDSTPAPRPAARRRRSPSSTLGAAADGE